VPGRVVRAVLFDLDGVLVDSREATERVWLRWASANGIGVEELRSAMHGVRSVEVVRTLRPELDAEAEGAWIEGTQAEDVGDVRAGAEDPLAFADGRRAHEAGDLKSKNTVSLTP